MYRRCVAPTVHGPRRLQVSPVHAGRSGGSAPDRSFGGRGGQRRQAAAPNSDERRDERWDKQRDERREWRRREEREDGGSRVDRSRGGGENGFGGGRRYGEEAAGAEKAWRPTTPRGSGGRSGPQQRQQRQQRQQQQPWARRQRDEPIGRDDVINDDEDDGEYDEMGDGEAPGRHGGGGAAAAAGPCLRDTLQGEALYGVFPVLAALRAKRRVVHRAYLLSSMDLSKRKDAGLVRQVEALCTKAGVEVVRTSRHELNLMSGDRPHQGLVLDVSPLEWASLDEFPPAEKVMAAAADAVRGGGASTGPAAPPVWLALDEVVDPQNLGAVVRSAYCLGAAGVLACARNCAPLSAIVSKASAGSLEALPLHSCRNLPRTLLDARDAKGWAVLGAAAGAGSEPVGRVQLDRPTILVLGSEGFGLRTNVRRACSGLVRVDMAPVARAPTSSVPSSSSSSPNAAVTSAPRYSATSAASGGSGAAPDDGDDAAAAASLQQQLVLRGLVDSLNVSVATGILLHSLINSASVSATGPTAAAPGGPPLGAAAAVFGF